MKPSTPAAQAKVEEAMRLVEEAQHTLERAAQLLSSLRHGADLCTKASKLRDSCHKFFYVLRKALDNRNGMSVDSECERCGSDLKGWRWGDPPHQCEEAKLSFESDGRGFVFLPDQDVR